MACNGGGGFALGLLVGGVIGAAAGLLLAPKPGAETRSELMEMGETWRTRADSMAADVRSRGMQELTDVSQRVGPAVDSLKARGASTVAVARSRIVSSADGAQPQPDSRKATRNRGWRSSTPPQISDRQAICISSGWESACRNMKLSKRSRPTWTTSCVVPS